MKESGIELGRFRDEVGADATPEFWLGSVRRLIPSGSSLSEICTPCLTTGFKESMQAVS